MSAIYVAGPMTGLPEFNYPAFNEATRLLRNAGYSVECPASIPAPDQEVPDLWRYYMGLAIPMLLRCDAIALLPDWGKSRGARLETTIARGLGYDVYYYRGEGLLEKAIGAEVDYVLKYM